MKKKSLYSYASFERHFRKSSMEQKRISRFNLLHYYSYSYISKCFIVKKFVIKYFIVDFQIAIRQENKELRRILYCRRCGRHLRSCLFLPCRHLLYCWDCGELFRCCEVCRAFIMQRLHVIM